MITQLGYLEQEYATTSYASSGLIDSRGLQFSVVNGKKDLSSEFSALVSKHKNGQIQFESVTTKVKSQEFMKTTIPSYILYRAYEESNGYLEDPYLVLPYLRGNSLVEKRPSLQFLVSNTKEGKHGVQFLAVNRSQKNNGSQFTGKITRQTSVGSQFYAVNTKDDKTGVQVSANISSNKNSGSQFFGKITKDDKTGSQFEVKNSKLKTRQAQFLAKITNDDKTGVQFLGRITKDDKTGSQFTAFISKIKNNPAQFLGKITNDDKTGVQFLAKITKQIDRGSEFKIYKVKKNGLQFRSVIYNTTQIRFLTEFASRGLNGNTWAATSTATSTSNAFHVNNLNTDIVEQVWRSTSLITQVLRCDTQNTSGEFVDTLAILNHNLTQGATVLFQGSNDANFETIGVSEILENNVKNTFWIAKVIPLNAYRYWRLEISDPANPDGYIQIGSIVFGAASIFSSDENFTDEVNFGFKQFEDKIFTEGHTNVSNDRGQKRFIELSFDKLKADGANFKKLRRAYLEYGTLLKVLYVPIPQDPAAFSVFAKMSEVPQENHIYTGSHYVSLEIKLDESL